MKMILMIFALGLSLLNAHVAATQTLTSQFTGQTKQGHFLTLKYAGPATWILSDFTPCSKYPCSVQDQTATTRLTASWISNHRNADGNTVIALSNGMTVTFINNGMVPPNPNGTRVESYWQLEIPAASGSTEIVRLHFAPRIE